MSQVVTSSQMLGAALRHWRRASALTQAEVAERLGLAQKAISALENHTDRSGINRLMQVLAALDLELVLQPRASAPAQAEDW